MPIKQDAIPMFVPQGTNIHLSRRKPNNFGRFQAVGTFSTVDKKSKYDVLEAIASLSKGAQQLFLNQKRLRDDSNRILIPRELQIGSAPYKCLMRLCKEINSSGLTAVIKKPHIRALGIEDMVFSDFHLLMLNPGYIKCRNQAEAQIFWRTVTDAK